MSFRKNSFGEEIGLSFRKNFFGDSIAQPGATRSELDDVLLSIGCYGGDFNYAEIFPEADADEKFGCGGILYAQGEDDDGEVFDAQIQFDGFATNAAAHGWLLDIGLAPSQIEESA